MKKLLLSLLFLFPACSTLQSPPPSTTSPTAQAAASEAPKATKYVSDLPFRGLNTGAKLTKLAFGSCANQDQPQPIWKTIESNNPELFIFMGDNVYASNPTQTPRSEQYKKLDHIPEFRSIREKVPFLVTWDDHDFGLKDGGASWTEKDAAQEDLMNFWSYTRAALPMDQKGIYHSKIIGPKKQRVQIILLDTRYFRGELLDRPGLEGKAYNFLPNEKGTVLGDAQWKWLEKELKKPAELRIVVSSYQLIPNDPTFEKWGNFPKERQKFFDLIKKTKAKNVVIFSGDRHIGTISKMPLQGYGDLVEITASALNRPTKFSDADQFYVGNFYNKENFGLAQIDWAHKKMTVELKNMSNEVVNKIDIPLK